MSRCQVPEDNLSASKTEKRFKFECIYEIRGVVRSFGSLVGQNTCFIVIMIPLHFGGNQHDCRCQIFSSFHDDAMVSGGF